MKPTKEDIESYYRGQSHLVATRPSPDFASEGQIVRALIRIFDLPRMAPRMEWASTEDWGPVHAEKGDEGIVVHKEPGRWPCVRFSRTGTVTDVTSYEVEVINGSKD